MSGDFRALGWNRPIVKQIVEITALLTLVNLDRFNAAFGIGSAGFSKRMVCVPPDRPTGKPVAVARTAQA